MSTSGKGSVLNMGAHPLGVSMRRDSALRAGAAAVTTPPPPPHKAQQKQDDAGIFHRGVPNEKTPRVPAPSDVWNRDVLIHHRGGGGGGLA